MRLIDADALLERAVPHGWSTPLWVSDIVIKDAPTIDAVEVIRCQYCIWWDTKHPYGTLVPNAYHCYRNDRFYSAEHFCAYGERNKDET